MVNSIERVSWPLFEVYRAVEPRGGIAGAQVNERVGHGICCQNTWRPPISSIRDPFKRGLGAIAATDG